MSDLPIEDRKEIPLSVDQRLDALTADVRELARGINVQGALLESIVVAADSVLKKYLDLTRKVEKKDAPAAE